MPRTPLGQISGNSNQRGGKEGRLELTPYWRTKICGRMDTGDSPKVISDALQIPMSTISTTYRREPERHENESKFRSGRSTIITGHLTRRTLSNRTRKPEDYLLKSPSAFRTRWSDSFESYPLSRDYKTRHNELAGQETAIPE
jgi:hypothetical protein